MKTYKIHFIRHAQCEGASEGRYIGHTDAPLCKVGKDELFRLSEKFTYPQADVIFSSPLVRCTETAGIIYPGKTPVIIDGLSECNFGEFENKTAAELENNEDFSLWLSGEKVPPFGESSGEFGKRIQETFEKIADGMMKSGVFNCSLITHGGIISALLTAYGLPQASMQDWYCSPCRGFSARLDPALWMRNRKFEVYDIIPPDEE